MCYVEKGKYQRKMRGLFKVQWKDKKSWQRTRREGEENEERFFISREKLQKKSMIK